ncbi:MAG TPA: hypothetical protein VII75_03135 [Thermoanaerobaculia bacterium]|nr:hypothetical protein [Thermoanaerobaculia bacterium]
MRLRNVVLVLPALLCLAGCGTLFNKQRSDAATAAQTKFNDIKLLDLVKDERKHNGEMLMREIDIAQRQMTAARDARLLAIVTSSDDVARRKKLGEAIEARLKVLTDNDEDFAGLLTKIDEREESLRTAIDEYLILRKKSDPKPECSGTNPDVSKPAGSKWEFIQTRCGQLVELRRELASKPKGMLGAIALKISATENARAELATNLKAAEADARQMAKKLAEAQKAGKPVFDEKELEKLKERVANVTIPSAQQLSDAGIDDVRAAAALRWIEMQKAAVDKLLAAATSGEAQPPAGTSDALQIAAALPSLANQLQQGFRYPRVSALVMESQRLRIEADRYRRQLARVDEELALLREKLRRLRDETRAVSAAKSEFDANHTDVALAKYTEAWTASRIPTTAVEWKLIGLAHDRALDQSEAALAQWDALVRTPLEVLVAAEGSGLKPDDIARLLHAIELGAIGVGVY